MKPQKRIPHVLSFASPSVALRAIGGLVAFAFRHPPTFAGLAHRALRDRSMRTRLFRLAVDARSVRESPLFDAEWFLARNPQLRGSRLPPEILYLLADAHDGRHASPRFSGDAYAELNPVVRRAGVAPLAHYEQCGKFYGMPASVLDLRFSKPSFPEGAAPVDADFGTAPPNHRRTVVFASFFADGRIPETDLAYLRGLREIADNVVFVANAPLLPGEEERLRGLASFARCRSHGEYDFGSYRRGLEAARAAGLLDEDRCDELVLANNSCFGPVFPFSEAFGAMASRPCDFWGLTENVRQGGRPHLQSYFLVFRPSVFRGRALDDFFASREPATSRDEAVERFETQFTHFLSERGLSHASLVPSGARGLHDNPTLRPLALMRRWRMPLVKAKALAGCSLDDVGRTLAFIRRRNPGLGALLRPSSPPLPRVETPEESAAAHERTAAAVRERLVAGRPVRTLFLVSSPSMFPARPLFEAMRRDPDFDARIAVIPDVRWPGPPERTMAAHEAELSAAFPGALLPPLRPDAEGAWPDALADADLAVFPSPYDVSDFRYNPPRCAGRPLLGVHVNYGYFRSVYDRSVMAHWNYSHFWKAFFECEATLAEYREHSVTHGANAELTGYVKMDRLAECAPAPRRDGRPRVLLAPHHSVEGGANDALALSNFLRYADHFASLPECFPEIDFVMRPHPFLFPQLSHAPFWGPERTAEWRRAFLAHPNASWSDDGDYLPLFASCDACVQDCGSFLVEWLYVGRPCCYLLKSPDDAGKFSPLGRDCLRCCTIAYDAPAIDAFLRDVVLGGRDDLAAAREALRPSIMLNHPHAAEAALAAVRLGLGLPPRHATP